MNQLEHLKTYKLTLLTKSPLFIGSGKQYNKKEYYFDSQKKQIMFFNTEKFFQFLIEHKLLDKYEQYMFSQESNLKNFFRECGLSYSQNLIDYTVNTQNVFDDEHTLSEIHQFMRNANMQPYVPGSSVKGCLRTAILWKLIKQNENSIEKNSQEKYNKKNEINYGQTNNFEAKYYLNKLNLDTENPVNYVNSIMRAIRIFDSMPIDNSQMSIAAKIDVSVKGNERPIKKVVREVVVPGTKIEFILTIDEFISKELDADFIINAISEYGRYYKETFVKSFRPPKNAVFETFENCIVLGGGSGYFSKSILYPYYGKNEAVKEVAGIMQDKFPNGHHENDVKIGISPHMLKHTKYKQQSYHFGICEVKIEPCANEKQT